MTCDMSRAKSSSGTTTGAAISDPYVGATSASVDGNSANVSGNKGVRMKREAKTKISKLGKGVDGQTLALALVAKMVAYEREIDRKQEKSLAEARHVAFLRAFRVTNDNSNN